MLVLVIDFIPDIVLFNVLSDVLPDNTIIDLIITLISFYYSTLFTHYVHDQTEYEEQDT